MPNSFRRPDNAQQQSLDDLQVVLAPATQLPRIGELLQAHHSLGDLTPVGERRYYLVTDAPGNWLAILVFSAAAKHIRYRDQWIGWNNEQRRRRLSLITNSNRVLILPEGRIPNLASRAR